MKITIVGRGAWGGAFGTLLERNGHDVAYVLRDDTEWPQDGEAELVFMAVAVQAIRDRISELPSPNCPVVSLCKGLEIHTSFRVSGIITDVWKDVDPACISGPSLAGEVQQGAPTTLVAAADKPGLPEKIQQAVNHPSCRVYSSTDLAGVELGGSLKNVYALAAGMSEGMQIGENGMAGILTRSLAEMVRIAMQMGARQETLFGLSGMGDLMLTAYSGSSRNHQTGKHLGRGLSLDETKEQVNGVAEGVPTTKAVYEFVQKNHVKAPVIEEVYHVLYEGKSPKQCLEDLMHRQLQREWP